MTEHHDIPKIGDTVRISTETREEVNGLVVTVHGVGGEWSGKFVQPSINAVFVSTDPSKSDSYGRQIERYSSLQHFDQTAQSGMPAPGRYYDFV